MTDLESVASPRADGLTVVGTLSQQSVTWLVLAFAAGCALSSSYGFLSGAWPFGVVEGVWTFVALRRFSTSR